MCHNSLEFSQDVIENCSALLKYIQELIVKNIDLLLRDNEQRAVHISLNGFLDFLFARFTSVETVYRRESMKLWEGLIINLPKKTPIKMWVLAKYVPQPGEKSLWNFSPIQFEKERELQSPNQLPETKKQSYLERQKQMDTLTAQLEFIGWLVKTAKFKYSEIGSKLKIDMKIVKVNIASFLVGRVETGFAKTVQVNSVASLLACKEDREQLTKSSMRLFTQLFQLLGMLEDSEIVDLISQSSTSSGGSNDYLFNLAVQIVLIPAAHRLSLLVQDYDLESQLRHPCEDYIKRTLKLLKEEEQSKNDKNSTSDNFVMKELQQLRQILPFIDLDKLLCKNQQINVQPQMPVLIHPRILTSLLIGYLKIANQSQSLKNYLLEISEKLGTTIETWIESETPTYIESSRLLLHFMSQLRIPNETLFTWLTSKSFVYQKTSDLLLKFISDNWIRDKVHLGEYLIQKASKELNLLAVFIPILEFISTRTSGYQDVLIKQIPQNWGTAEFETEFAEKQVKIYSIIVSKCNWSFEKKSTKESVTFISFVIQQAKNFLSSVKHNIYFKKQVLQLVGLLYSLNLSEDHMSVHTRMKGTLETFLNSQLPIVSRDLVNNKNEIMNYEQLIEGYLDLLDLSKSSQVVQLLYRVIREHKPMYLSERIRSSLNNFILNVINKQPTFQSFFNLFDQFLTQFFDQSIVCPDDNLRWAIANKIINRVLETCSKERLEELLINIFTSRIQPSLQKDLAHLSQLELYNTVREKTHVLLMLEIVVRRLDPKEAIRGRVNKTLYPGDDAGNELIKYFITVARSAKDEVLVQFDQRCSDFKDKIQLDTLNSPAQVSRRFSCAGYTLLSSTIINTQTKQSVYQDFLFNNWEAIIDVQNESLYQFDVLTNFNSISLKQIESKVSQSKDFAAVKSQNLLREYMTSSFMQTNEKFNSAMVFETQLDPNQAKNKVVQIPELNDDQFDEAQDQDQENQNTLEIDEVNKHECMKNIKRVLDKMQELFQKEWTKDSIPVFMQSLLVQINSNTSHQNLKVFILKLLVNNPEVFKPYAQFWLKPICDFIIGKQKNGKGFHYFLRDLTTLLILWSDSYRVTVDMSSQLSKVINTIIRLAADKNKIIFNINIEMLAVLIGKWQSVVVIEKEQTVKMLSVLDATEGSHLWKMTAIQIIALACTCNIPVRNITDQREYGPEAHVFKLLDGGANQIDPLLDALLKCQGMNKKQLIFASSEALGKVLKNQPTLGALSLPFIMQNDVKEKHDVIVNVIERVTREFPNLLLQRRIFLKLLSYINNLTGALRSAIFKSLSRFYAVCSIGERKDITDSVKTICGDILSDTSEENQQSFLVFVSQVIRIDKLAGSEILHKVSERLKPVYIGNKNEAIREQFYDLMVYLYDTNEDFKSVAKSSLIRGLSDPSVAIQSKLLEYWNKSNRLSLDPFERMEQLLTVLYDQEEEHIWLNNAILLLMQVSRLSSDFNRKIFDEPLSNCVFQPLIINQNQLNVNRSQPVTPSLQMLAMTSTQQEWDRQRQRKHLKSTLNPIVEEATGSLENQEMHEEIMIDTANHDMVQSSEEHFKVAGQPSMPSDGHGSQHEQQFAVGFVRSTQELGQPIFNRYQFQQSSLYAPNAHNSQRSNNEIPQSQAFYQNINKPKVLKYQIKEPDEQQYGQKFGEPEGFVSVGLAKIGKVGKQRDKKLGSMMERNELIYQTVSESQGFQVRINKDGNLPSQLARIAEKKRQEESAMVKRFNQQRKDQVNLIRKYRVGEIPDIQIEYKDLLGPLMALVKRDSTIATEVLVELFTQIYKDTTAVEERRKLGVGIKGILQQSIKFDYGIINTMHRIAIELLKIDGLSIDPDVIERTGRSSMSFQTSLLLLEETILSGNHTAADPLVQQSKAAKAIENQKVTTHGFGQVTPTTKNYWFSLIQLYELVGNEDALKGIWCSIGNRQDVMMKQGVRVPNSVNGSANLIKQAQILKSQGNIRQGLEQLEQVLSNPEFEKIFEDQVQIELMNKKYESLAELSKWESITRLSIDQHTAKQLYDIPFYQAETMIRAQLRCEDQWQSLNNQMQSWQSDPTSKVYLEKRFNYEQAMLFITAGDFDRARFYVNKDSNDLLSQWKDLTKLSQVAQHFLVQKIQKIYEMKEFLQTTKQLSLKNYDELAPEALQQIQNWVYRQPSCSFDKFSVWDDILTARMLFLDLHKMNFKQGSIFNDQLEGRIPSRYQDIQNIGAILYTQSAKGAFRMGLLDTCDSYLKTALKQRSRDNQRDNLRVIVPIIKLKTEQFKQQTINFGFQEKFQNLEKILNTLEFKIEKDETNDFETKIKATVIKQKLHKKLLALLVKEVSQTHLSSGDLKVRQTQINNQLSFAFGAHLRVENLIQQTQTGSKDAMRAKSLFYFSKLCDKLLRQAEEESTQAILEKSFNKIDQNRDGIAKLCIKNAFHAINLGYLKARDLIPRLLDIVGKHDKLEIDKEFITASKDTPAWIFIRWISQLAAVMNRGKSEVIDEKVVQIYKKYPQAMFYPFNVLESNLRINILDENVATTALFQKTQQYFEKKFENLFSWTQALDCLVHPEQRMLTWIQLIEDAAVKCRAKKIRDKSDLLIGLMIDDIASRKKRYIGSQLGDYNKQFAELWLKRLTDLKNKKLAPDGLLAELKQIKAKVDISNLSKGNQKLSVFSEYLDNLDNNDFYNPEVYIEIPGQYDNKNQEPIQGKNVKIACITKTILILASKMRPKRITVHGSNEKDFNLLIKGGEDLRLDQRIQQIFHIVNGVFKEDSACQSRDLNLKTFGIVPITNSLGSLEWIDNTEPLKVMINREHQRVEKGTDLNNCAAMNATRQWLSKIPGNTRDDHIVNQHLTMMSLKSEVLVDAFTRHKQMMKWSLLRNGLENLCLTSSAFITIKNQFVKSIAVFSIVSYLLGIGDRHLENFLVNTTDGEILGIDFGCAFGAGIQQSIPELMPFRLTQQIEGVIAPHPNDGIYKQTMVHVLNALRKKKNIILDTCDIFVKEPLLDWVKKAQSKIQDQYGLKQSPGKGEEQLEQLSFYPKQKIQTLKDKLNGRNPVRISIQELNDSSHYKRPYYEELVKALKGANGSMRSSLMVVNEREKRYLTVEEQVECLIELARDPNILGRVWIGWGAYI